MTRPSGGRGNEPERWAFDEARDSTASGCGLFLLVCCTFAMIGAGLFLLFGRGG